MTELSAAWRGFALSLGLPERLALPHTPRMEIPLLQVDAFADEMFSGNPAAVCLLLEWLKDDVMQAIAQENNLSETAFLVPVPERYRLRWFTPTVEVNLCGHATLAAAHVVMNHLEPGLNEIVFDSRSGPLRVVRDGRRLSMDFPSLPAVEVPAPRKLIEALAGPEPQACFGIERAGAAPYYMLVYETAGEVAALEPNFATLAHNVIVTADGAAYDKAFDFVSRFFAPVSGVNEDPATGSAHCTLTPYWSARLGKSELVARQISRRGGTLYCQQAGERVHLAGHSVDYMQGSIHLGGR